VSAALPLQVSLLTKRPIPKDSQKFSKIICNWKKNIFEDATSIKATNLEAQKKEECVTSCHG